MRFPAMNSQRRQKVSIPKLNGGVNYRDAMNLVEDNQLTDVKNMWFKDGALRTRYGFTINNEEKSYSTLSKSGADIVSRCFCKASGKTYIVERTKSDDGFISVYVHAFDAEGLLIGAKQAFSELRLVSFDGLINGKQYDAIAYTNTNTTYGIFADDEDTAGFSFEELSPYAPVVLLNGVGTSVTGTASVGGDIIEGYNILTDKFQAYYNTDEESTEYYLPTNITGTITVEYSQGETEYRWVCGAPGEVTSDDIKMTAFLDHIEFSTPLPKVEGRSNNLKVTAQRKITGDHKTIPAKTFAWFGGTRSGIFGGTRLFVAGDEEYPNRVYFSSLNNPLYFSENNYIDVGSADSAVTAFGKQSDMLVIFKEDETYYTTYVAGEEITADKVMSGLTVDIETLRATFPISQLSGNIGCDLPETIRNMQNRLMWADTRGRVWTLIYSSEYSTRNIRAVGGLITRKLNDSNINIKSAVAATYDNYYMLFAVDFIKRVAVGFVLDTEDYGYAYYTSYGSDKKAQNSMGWYVWEIPSTRFEFSTDVAGAPLLFAKEGKKLIAYTMKDGADKTMEADGTITQTTIPCMFQTKLFDMRQPERDKSFDRVYISVGKSQELCAEAVYVTDKGNFIDSAKIACEGISDAFTAQFIDNKTLSPNIRAKRFALRMENNGTMYIDGISVYYR